MSIHSLRSHVTVSVAEAIEMADTEMNSVEAFIDTRNTLVRLYPKFTYTRREIVKEIKKLQKTIVTWSPRRCVVYWTGRHAQRIHDMLSEVSYSAYHAAESFDIEDQVYAFSRSSFERCHFFTKRELAMLVERNDSPIPQVIRTPDAFNSWVRIHENFLRVNGDALNLNLGQKLPGFGFTVKILLNHYILLETNRLADLYA